MTENDATYETPDKSIPIIRGRPEGNDISPPITYLCKNCQTNPAILNRKTGKPTHGLCKDCWYAKFKAGMVQAKPRRQAEKGGSVSDPKHDKKITPGKVEPLTPWPDPPPVQPMLIAPGDASLGLRISWLLTSYPDVAEHLHEAAVAKIRPDEYQALAYIVEGLKRDNFGVEKP